LYIRFVFGEAGRGVAELLRINKTSQHTLPHIIPHVTILLDTKTKKNTICFTPLRPVLYPPHTPISNKKIALFAQKKRIFSITSITSMPHATKKTIDYLAVMQQKKLHLTLDRLLNPPPFQPIAYSIIHRNPISYLHRVLDLLFYPFIGLDTLLIVRVVLYRVVFSFVLYVCWIIWVLAHRLSCI
jgi:hypothetical protein